MKKSKFGFVLQVMEEDEGAVGGGESGEGVPGVTGEGGEGEGVEEKSMSQLELEDLTNEDAVTKLMKMLEGQVDQLDKKLA